MHPGYKPRRMKRKPPKDTQCDMSVGVDSSGFSPRVKRCPNTATVEFKGAAPVGETWVCDDCAKTLDAHEAERTEAPNAE